jgi:DNA polymerase-3 subunit delta
MILFFYGANSFAARAKLGQLKEQYIAKNGNDFGLDQLDGERIKLQELIQQFQAVPFLATSRLIIVENLGKNKQVAEEILGRLDEVPESTIVILYDPEVDKRSKYFKALSKLPRAAEFKPMAPPQLARWIEDEATRLGSSIERPAVQELLNRCGDDQWRLAGEITKLATYSEKIVKADVEAMVEVSEEQNIFAFLDSVMAKDVRAALSGLERLQATGQNEMYILTMLLWQLRQVLLAKFSGTTNSGELAKRAGMSPYAAGKALTLARKTDEDVLKDMYSACMHCERDIKLGKAKPEELIEALVMRLCQTV